MIFENVDWTCAKNASSTYLDLYVVSGTKNANHYFGYTCYAPNLIFNGTFKVTLTGKRNGGSSSTTASLGTIYAGKFGTGNYSDTCHGCDGTYSATASTYDTTTYGKVTNNTTTSISSWKN